MHSTACCEGIFRSQPGRHGSQPGRSSASKRSPPLLCRSNGVQRRRLRRQIRRPLPPGRRRPLGLWAGWEGPNPRHRARPPVRTWPVPPARTPWVTWRVGLTADRFRTTGPAGSAPPSLLSWVSAGPLAGVLDRRSLPTVQTRSPVGRAMQSGTAAGPVLPRVDRQRGRRGRGSLPRAVNSDRPGPVHGRGQPGRALRRGLAFSLVGRQ